jgi:DNA-binding response OmpR family regulator
VEDEYYIADEMCHALRNSGATVLGPVPTVAAGLDLVRSGCPDCAVLDLNLRGESGLEVAEEMRRRNVAVIFATGYAPASATSAFSDALHLEKPIRAADLVSAVAQLYHRREQPDHYGSSKGHA